MITGMTTQLLAALGVLIAVLVVVLSVAADAIESAPKRADRIPPTHSDLISVNSLDEMRKV